jgi:hypothetical protein
MPIPPGYTSVSVERICQPDFEELEIDIPGSDGERNLRMCYTVVDAKCAPSAKHTQQAEQAGFTRAEITRRASQFSLKINKRQSS